jgi:solute carrier family 25 S-adenosylmethionine transporter 26
MCPLQAVMARVGEQQQFLGPLAGGVAAGLASSLVRVPTEVVKTRMQTGGFRSVGMERPASWI